ncbi:hypothetical protein FHS43_002526 [Streptosporangium becharense]|uniref:EF-hand domain-containing protein n=1 Tax=Streptosporangium becharense TaxID=1816182 RepID=A0A7W9MIJ1_9ACTN|nr:hypothetical protein [Streptosporangium becharense]MBB2911261.1 hypothetical protein [Streptosporangium becharense]MBB5821681.1 hypothetical protein [Streptosporangium becharense]
MTGSGFSGVKQPEFDTMTGKHTQAAGQLERLAQTLYAELQRAGLDTAPALRIRELAGRVGKQAEDLRRRQTLIREMEQQKVSFGTSRPEGSFLEMPDGLDAAQGLLDGTVASNAALLAAGGDAKALAQLQKYAKRAGDPEFVKAFLRKLGAKGITELPGSLAAQLRDRLNHGDSASVDRLSAQGKDALRLLSAALARGTDPKNKAYMGDDFLKKLAAQGRAQHTFGDTKYGGYQAQALIWRAHEGKPPFSARFMEVVGSDVVAYEHEQYKNRWAASKDVLGEVIGGGRQVPLFDLGAALGLGTLLHTGQKTWRDATKKVRPAVLEDLLHIASTSKESSQALLSRTPPGWKHSVLTHLLTTRLRAFRYTGSYGTFVNVLLNTTTDQDATSKKLAAEMIKTLGGEIRKSFGKADTGNLAITNRGELDRHDFLRYPLARAMAANIDQFSELLIHHGTFDKADATDLSYALALAARDDKGFEALVRAQTEHMKAALATVPPLGLKKSNLKELGFTEADLKKFDFDDDGKVGKDDVRQFLVDRIVSEARPFSHIVEIRRQALIAEGLDDKKASEALRTMVRDAVGVLPVPGSRWVGAQAEGALSKLMTNVYEKTWGIAYDEGAKQAARLAAEGTPKLDESYRTLANDRIGVERLAEQMIATAMLEKGMLDDVELEGQSFFVGAPPKIKSFTEMSPGDYKEFLEWVNENSGSADLLERFRGTFRITSEVDDYLSLQIPSSKGDGK